MKTGSVCTGYGGLDRAVHEVLGGELAWVADIDEGACKILAERFPSQPNHGDITAIEWATTEPIDVLTAGFPCQPVSLAGKRLGEADERWIWPDVARAVRDLRPGLVFLENVSALVVRGLAGVAADLAEIGYVGSWCCVRASDVGACHRRERVFILAWPAADAQLDDIQRRRPRSHAGDGRALAAQARQLDGVGGLSATQDADRAASGERRLAAPRQAPGGRPRADAGRPGGAPAAHAAGNGRDARRPEPARLVRGPHAAERRDAPAYADGRRLAELPELDGGTIARLDRALRHDAIGPVLDWGIYALAIRRHERAFGRPAPRPTEPGRTGERLSPRFVEWMMSLPEGWVTDVPGLSRNAQLKALGNGVVPQQAAMALRMLLERAGIAPLVAAEGAA